MDRNFTITGVRPSSKEDHARRETVQSLIDGVARWPDGRPRNGQAYAIAQEQDRLINRCEVTEALGLDR